MFLGVILDFPTNLTVLKTTDSEYWTQPLLFTVRMCTHILYTHMKRYDLIGGKFYRRSIRSVPTHRSPLPTRYLPLPSVRHPHPPARNNSN